MRGLFRSSRLVGGVAALGALALLGGCSAESLNIINPNAPTVDDFTSNPTRRTAAAVATGIFAGTRGDPNGFRGDITAFIWKTGVIGREGYNLQGVDPRQISDLLYAPMDANGLVGAGLWLGYYQNIRTINGYLTALPGVEDFQPGELEASEGFAQVQKALSLMYVIAARPNTGAPVAMGVTSEPAPFVSTDSVYGYILGLLAGARTKLQAASAAGAGFPFPTPPGYASFSTPATHEQFVGALEAKANILRATDANCGQPCFQAALDALARSFLLADPSQFRLGAYFDYSSAANDRPNGLSEPLAGPIFFVHPSFEADAQLQDGSAVPDLRLLQKTAPAPSPATVIFRGDTLTSSLKWTVYFTNGGPDLGAPIPIIRNEELILLRAEAELGLGDKPGAIADLDLVRTNSGGLPPLALRPVADGGPLTSASSDAEVLSELLYNRRYSLAWEQGTRWIDARRYGLLGTLPLTGTQAVPVFPVPDAECLARGLSSGCSPLGS